MLHACCSQRHSSCSCTARVLLHCSVCPVNILPRGFLVVSCFESWFALFACPHLSGSTDTMLRSQTSNTRQHNQSQFGSESVAVVLKWHPHVASIAED
jgi:hypothetical protein